MLMMKCFGTLKDGEPVTKEALDMYDKLYKDKLPQKEFVAACEMFLSSRAALGVQSRRLVADGSLVLVSFTDWC